MKFLNVFIYMIMIIYNTMGERCNIPEWTIQYYSILVTVQERPKRKINFFPVAKGTHFLVE